MEEDFVAYHYGAIQKPRLSTAIDPKGKKRLCVDCDCASRAFYLSNGQAKHCAECGLLMARVGNVITLAKQ